MQTESIFYIYLVWDYYLFSLFTIFLLCFFISTWKIVFLSINNESQGVLYHIIHFITYFISNFFRVLYDVFLPFICHCTTILFYRLLKKLWRFKGGILKVWRAIIRKIEGRPFGCHEVFSTYHPVFHSFYCSEFPCLIIP